MQFGYLGINYKRAELSVRDKTAFTDIKKIELLQRAGAAGINQCMVLSTCNRSELFFFYEGNNGWKRMWDIYCGMFPDVAAGKYARGRNGEEAIAYLFRVAAGMESLVIGEDQILGQVKEALDFSRTMGYSGKELNKTVRDAITCAKKIKTQLRISEKPLSVSYIGIQKLEKMTGIAGKKVLVIGSGGTAALALRYIYEYGAGEVTVCSRTAAHARELGQEFPELSVVTYDRRYECMRDCDIVVSATSSPHLVVRRECFTPEKKMVFLDLAAPRDIDILLGEEELVEVINLDTLQKIARENQSERERLTEEGRSLIETDVKETLNWLMQSRVDVTIQSLQQRCHEIAEDSYDYLNRKIELGTREKKILKKVLNASLQRLIREPIQELKQIDTKEKQDEYNKMIHQLFRMDDE